MEPLYCSAANRRISKTAVLRGFPNLSISFEASLTRQSGNWIFTQGELSGRLNYNRTRGKLLTLLLATHVWLVCSPQIWLFSNLANSLFSFKNFPGSVCLCLFEFYSPWSDHCIFNSRQLSLSLWCLHPPHHNLVALPDMHFTYLLFCSLRAAQPNLHSPQPPAHLLSPFCWYFLFLFQNVYAGSYKCNFQACSRSSPTVCSLSTLQNRSVLDLDSHFKSD